MNTRTKILSIAYFMTGILCILLEDQASFFPGLIVKALIIPVLMILFVVNLKPLTHLLYRIMFAGLFFSWAGDVILEFSQSNGSLFVPGLVSFLLAHVMYLTVFLKTPGKNSVMKNRAWLLIPVLLFGALLVKYLYAGLGDMKIPVILYAIVILTMLTAAINRIEKVNSASFYMVLSGAILFVISDSAIAVNKFGHRFESSGVVIMSTYIIAQYLIITGYIKQFDEEHV
jgi:uncharacterized membrane protein YhhN